MNHLRHVLGRKIVGVVGACRPTREGPDPEAKWFLDAIVLDDGSQIRFAVCETDFDEYEIKATQVKKR